MFWSQHVQKHVHQQGPCFEHVMGPKSYTGAYNQHVQKHIQKQGPCFEHVMGPKSYTGAYNNM